MGRRGYGNQLGPRGGDSCHGRTALAPIRRPTIRRGAGRIVIRVVLADDQALVRSGLRALLANSDDLQVVGEASNGREAVAVVTRTRPDVVLMDARMPALDGIEA